MNCLAFEALLEAYVDGELGVDETVAAEGHAGDCPRCRRLADRERQFRQLLRRQPKETAPAEVRQRIVRQIRRSARRSALRPLVAVPALAAAAALLLTLWPALRPAPEIVGALVDKHIAYAQLERPAEFASRDRDEVGAWFRQRAGLRIVVPDYSPAGIRLIGARIADVESRRAAYVLYEKGHTLLSVFVAPGPVGKERLAGSPVSYRGYEYLTAERKGYRTVSWTDGQVIFGLVSMLDYDALLECADTLRMARAAQTRI